MPDLKDTIRRLRHLGNNYDLTEMSNYVRIADAFISVERDRLDRAVKRTKKALSDWAGSELDSFWGAILSVDRLPGVESTDEYLADPAYTARLEKFMSAANTGATLEAVREAAESGAGLPMTIERSGQRIILTPEVPLSAAQKMGALKNARRIAPAKALIEIGQPEGLSATRAQSFFSDTNYMGQKPDGKLMNGPVYISPTVVRSVRANKWARSPAGTLAETDGTAANLMRNGAYCSGLLGFGERITIEVEVAEEPINAVEMDLARGDWEINIENAETGDTVHLFRMYGTVGSWMDSDAEFDFTKAKVLHITITNIDQDERALYVRGLYLGAKVKDDNRSEWLSLGGLKGQVAKDIVNATANNITQQKEWISSPAPSTNSRRTLYITLSDIPRKVSSIGFATGTPGCIFELYHSSDRVSDPADLAEARWTKVPGSFILANGKTKVPPFTARHLKMVITSLRPMTMHQFKQSGNA